MNISVRFWILAFLVILLPHTWLQADQAADEKLIAAAVSQYVSAFNSHDAKKVAALWTAVGVYSNPQSGEEAVGRDEIEKQLVGVFAELANAKLEVESKSIQFISPTVAVEQGIATRISPDQEPDRSDYSAVYVKVNGVWLVDRISEDAIEIAPSNYEYLKELEWMVGSWVDKSDDAKIETECKWTKNRSFLVRQFAVESGESIEFSGLQIIGWDPERKAIRSWVFDSDGGFGEGNWKRHDNTWYVKTTGTLPDGGKGSGTSILTYVDDNSFRYQTVERQIDGEILPNVPETVIVRQEASE